MFTAKHQTIVQHQITKNLFSHQIIKTALYIKTSNNSSTTNYQQSVKLQIIKLLEYAKSSNKFSITTSNFYWLQIIEHKIVQCNACTEFFKAYYARNFSGIFIYKFGFTKTRCSWRSNIRNMRNRNTKIDMLLLF